VRIEDELRTLEPPALVPGPDLADAVLRGVRRRRALTPVAALLAAVAVAVPVAVAGGPRPAPAAATVDLGGGVTVTAYTEARTERTWLLDPATGRYAEVPYRRARLSPDGRRVAFRDGDRVGVVTREALLAGRAGDIRWLALPGGTYPVWSPDGTAVLSSLILGTGPRTELTVRRWDPGTGSTASTRLSGRRLLGPPQWAANSRDYLVQVIDPDGTARPGTTPPVVLQVLRADGVLGDRLPPGARGRLLPSPDGSRVVVDADDPAAGTPTVVLDAGLTRARVLPGRAATVGWSDADSVVRLAGGNTLRVESTGDTPGLEREVPLTGLPELIDVQIGLPAR
jgi:hypothetical protein